MKVFHDPILPDGVIGPFVDKKIVTLCVYSLRYIHFQPYKVICAAFNFLKPALVIHFHSSDPLSFQ